MPSLGADMEVGTILEWRVAPGDEVHRGDIVALVDTEKSDIEVEVFEDGIVEELLVGVGEEVPVGTPLARLAAVGAAAAPPAELPAPEPAAVTEPAVTLPSVDEAAVLVPAAPPALGPVESVAPPPGPGQPHVRSSPYARRQAAAQGVDLAGVAGSGPSGAVRAADVGAAEVPAPAPAPLAVTPTAGRDDRQRAMRHAIAELMSRSVREIPHYHLASTIELGGALAWLERTNAERSVEARVLPAALLLKATALAAREVPVLNGTWADGALRPADHVHLGVAVSLRGGGLVAPAIVDADERSLDDLMAMLRDLVARARAGRLRSSEMAPTITVTNLGDQGADEVHGVIYPPQVALVGFGRIVDRPWALDGLLGVRPVVRASLAADHRATDGHDGSRFLVALDRLLHAPEDL